MLAELTRPINIDAYNGLVVTLTDSIARSGFPIRESVKAGQPNLDRKDREEMALNKIFMRGMDEAMMNLASSRPPFGLIRDTQRDNPLATPRYEPFNPFDPRYYTGYPRELAYKVLAECLLDTLSDSLSRRLWAVSQGIEAGDRSTDSALAFQRISQLKEVAGPYMGQDDPRFKKLFTNLPAAANTIPGYLKGIAYAALAHGICLPPTTEADVETVTLFEEIANNTYPLTVETARLHSAFTDAEIPGIITGFLDDTSGRYDHSFVFTLKDGKIVLDYEPAFWTFKPKLYEHYGISEEEGCPALQVPSAARKDDLKQQSLLSALWRFGIKLAPPLYRYLYLN